MQENNNSFNYKITKYFLSNNRLTIMAMFLLVIIGLFATFSLKTTGFPSPEIKFAQIVSIYPGASSDTVVKEVTIPVENAVKNIEGVKTFTSTSNNSFSAVAVTINENANADSVRSKIDASLRSVSFPVGVESPKVIAPDISGPDFIFVVLGNDPSKMYNLYSKAKKDLLQISDTSNVNEVINFSPKLLVTINDIKARQLGISIEAIKTQLKFVGEILPVVSDVNLDSQSKSITTKLSGTTVDDIKNIEFTTANNSIVKLSEIAVLKIDYQFDKNNQSNYGYSKDGKAIVAPAITFEVKASKGTDLSKYATKVYDKFALYNDDSNAFIRTNEKLTDNDKTKIVETYSTNDSNVEQVGEVVSGLVGGPLKDVEGAIKYAGFVFGGIQLIFLVMLAFVSWRAALVAALSIPLSLIFANIFLYFTGHDLNTLTLFSLVLVLGLVVDPTLVVLEAIQRKKDAGFTGKQAALEAIKDVGNGLFLATLCNIIVFIPFGVISGILGQIFSYIPLTIIPALIGSYIVPLIFLAWIGGLILKPSKKKTGTEEENMWGLAKWLVKTNMMILHSSRIIRLVIIIFALIIPISIAGYYFGTGKVKSVQFASSDDAQFMQLAGTFLPTIPKEERDSASKTIINTISSTKGVKDVYLYSTGVNYFINLVPKKDRPNLKAQEIADNINSQLQDKVGTKFFDIKADLIQTGPPASSYQVTIGVKSDDLKVLLNSSADINKTLNKVCLIGRTISIDDSCKDGKRIVTKVDDGFTGKENKVIEILLDRNKLNKYELTVPNAPLTAIVNAQIKALYGIGNTSDSDGTITYNNEDIDILLEKTSENPKKIDDIKNIVVFSPITRQPIKLSDIATITETNPKASITRVKGQTVGNVKARLEKGNDDQGTAALVTDAVINYYKNNNWNKAVGLGLQKDSIEQYSEGDSAGFIKSFSELSSALLLAIILIYFVLALFFKSFTLPIVILFTIPLTFIGVFPALSGFVGGQFGFLEIIGLIILTGLVVNVAIFLIDAARQKVLHENWDHKRAISYASGVRLRPVLLTKFTAIASLMPLAIFSEFYRSIAIVIMFGLLTSGFTSLFTTPILYVFFRWLSYKYHNLKWWGKILFIPFFPIYIIVLAITDKKENVTQY